MQLRRTELMNGLKKILAPGKMQWKYSLDHFYVDRRINSMQAEFCKDITREIELNW